MTGLAVLRTPAGVKSTLTRKLPGFLILQQRAQKINFASGQPLAQVTKREQMLAHITSPGWIPGLESQPDSSARAWCIFVRGHLGEGGGELMISEASAADSGCKREGDLLEEPS